MFVSAWTDVGEGPSSNKVHIHTDEDYPDSPPKNVTYENLSSTAILLSWLPPDEANGIITHYTIYYYPMDDFSSTQFVNR